MNKKILGMAAGLLAFAASSAWAATDWSAQDYSLYPGDFNGDGKTDLLYVAKDPSKASGIAISDATGAPNTSHQSWPSNYLGIPWSTGSYSGFVADFSGDGKADILLQRTSPGDSYLLQANADGKIVGISQTIASSHMSIGWTADQHKLVVGDFNADGRADLFFQAAVPSGTHAVVLADANGQFTGSATQTWNDGYLGLNWSASKAFVFAGKFNGDSRADLLVQARPNIVMVDFDIPIPVPTYPPNMNGIAFSQASGSLFQLAGVQTWSRMANGVDWSPLTNNVVVGDFNGDGRDDVIFQKRNSAGSSYMLASNASGAAFAASPTALSSNVTLSADGARLIAGNFDGAAGVGVYVQALTSSGTNYVANSYASGSLTAAAHNPATPTGVAPATAVGHTVGTFAVSNMGAATYSIPIVVPPGIAGVQPQLSIEYQSGAGNGLLGLGWSLGGLSTIERCRKTLVQDNESSRVSLTAADAFCIDGNRMRLTSGVYGASGSTYQTELETFARITANGSAGNGPAHFVMEAKNGLIYEYGNSADSRIESLAAGYTTTARAWALSKVRDRAGNTMLLSYEEDAAPNGSYRPSEIVYTSNSGAGVATGAYKVKFVWDPRPSSDPLVGYYAGGFVNETKRLNRIETQYNGGAGFALVRRYQLSYNVSGTGKQSRLASVQECDTNSNCLSPTMISWQDGQSGVGGEVSSGDLGSLVKYSLPLDINGDGRADLVFPRNTTWWYMLSTAAGYGTATDTGVGHDGNYNKVIPTDFNADGKTDFLVPNGSGVWQVLIFNGSTFSATSTGQSATGAGGQAWVLDVNGDGLQDLVYISGQNVYAKLHNGSNYSSSTTTLYTLQAGYSFSEGLGYGNQYFMSDTQIADYNGDGRADLILSAIMDLECYWSPEVPGTCYYNVVLYSGPSGYTADWEGAFPESQSVGMRSLDVNGDGLTDVAYSCWSALYAWTGCLRFGTGSGLTPATNIYYPQSPKGALVLDWDSDGRADLLYNPADNYPPAPQNWRVMKSTGTGFGTDIDTGIPAGPFPQNATAADVNGDGQSDFLNPGSSTNSFAYRLHNGLQSGSVGDVVTAITDGFGNNVAIVYSSLTDSSIYTKGSGATYPTIDLQAPIQVVKQYTASDGTGGAYSVTNKYEGAKVNVQGRGYLGFSRRSSTDSRTSIRTTQDYLQTFPYVGAVSAASAVQADGTGSTISSTSTTYADLQTNPTAYNDRHFPYAQTSVQITREVGGPSDGLAITQVTTTTVVDSYGNPSNVTVTTADQTGSGQSFVTQTANTITNDITNWCLGFVTQQTVANTTPSLPAQTRTTHYTSDAAAPTMCRVKTQTIEPTIAASTVTTTFAFDAFGHPTSQTVSATGITNRVTTTSYGAKGVFPVSVTNAESEAATKTYDYALGVPLSATDPNGIAVSWIYDGFGRKTRENRPDGTATTWSLAACNVGNGYCGNSLLRYQVTEQQLNASTGAIRTAMQSFDAQGRVKFDQSQTLSGAYSVVATNYDNQGRVYQKSQPYFAGFPAYYTTFAYDLVGRPSSEARQISEANTGTQTTTYGYNRLVHSQTDANSKLTVKTMNAVGQVMQMTDPNTGNTYYTYDQFGNLLTTKDPLNNVITNTFNIRGYKMTTSDPNMGNWSYTYYRTGELNTQTDAKAKTVTFTYDKVSRPKTRAEFEGTTTWTWGVSAPNKNIGKLASVASPGSYSESYTYDSLGRPSQVSTTADATAYLVNNTYSTSTGMLETVTYPTSTAAVPGSRFKVQYDYAYGLLQAVKDFNAPTTIYWQQIATNAAGQTIDEQYGNGLHTYSTYDSLTTLLGSRTAGTTSQVQNLTYQWDKVGNLTQRKDNNLNLTEDFVYDNLYRLDYSNLNGVQNLNVDYNAAGNITTKSDVGSYTYPASGASSVRPHAVTGAGTNTFAYDANGNMSTKNGSTITWFSYNLPNKINKGTSYAQFFYGAGRGRYKQIAVTAAGGPLPAGTETTIYIGGLFEKVTKPSAVVEYKHYVLAGKEAIAVKTLRSNSTNDVRYLQKDHLGSVDVITNEAGAVVQRLSYDAFGKRRNATAWSGALLAGDWTNIAAMTHRGFTFHEQLDNVDMVHMNGRVYDPTIGRFISADPFIQAPLMSQSLNRYSYVMNNPLSLIDPSGYSWLSKLWRSIRGVVNYVIAAVLYVAAAVVAIGSQGVLSPLAAKLAAAATGFLVFARSGGTGGRGPPEGIGTPGFNPNPLQATGSDVAGRLPTKKEWEALDKVINVFFANGSLKQKGGVSVRDEEGVVTIRVQASVWAQSPDVANRFIAAVGKHWGTSGALTASDGMRYALIVDMRVALEKSSASILVEQVMGDAVDASAAQGGSVITIQGSPSPLTLAHEFGHVLGFHDFYQKMRDPRTKKDIAGDFKSAPGFENTLMHSGAVVTGDMLGRVARGYERP